MGGWLVGVHRECNDHNTREHVMWRVELNLEGFFFFVVVVDIFVEPLHGYAISDGIKVATTATDKTKI